MAFVPLKSKKYSTTGGQMGFLTTFRDAMVNDMGWELVIDQTTLSTPNYFNTPYIIIKSKGENNDVYPVHVIVSSTIGYSYNDYVKFSICTHYDETTHTPLHIRTCFTIFQNTTNNQYQAVWIDDTSDTNFILYANKDFFYFHITDLSSNNTSYVIVSKVNKFILWNNSVKQFVSNGLNAEIYFNEPLENNFIVGSSYICINQDGQFDHVTVNNIDHTNKKITVDTLYRSLDVGSYIGAAPYPWWFNVNCYNRTGGNMQYSCGTYDYEYVRLNYTNSTYEYIGATYDTFPIALFPEAYLYVDYNNLHNGSYLSIPLVLMNIQNNAERAVYGVLDHLFYIGQGTDLSTFGNFSANYSGQPTSYNNNTLTDTSKTFEVNGLKDKAIIIVGGQNEGDIQVVESNTSNTITIVGEWLSPLDGTSEYKIYDSAYMRINSPRTDTYGYFSIRIV